MLYCQREAAETAIFLAEVAGRHGTADYRARLEPFNAEHSNGMPRVALKMATGLADQCRSQGGRDKSSQSFR